MLQNSLPGLFGVLPASNTSLFDIYRAMKSSDPTPAKSYIDTPEGIITEMGIRFSTTQHQLEEYAGELLDHISLPSLLKRANIWLRFPQNISILTAPFLLHYMDVRLSLGILFGLFLFTSILGPVVISHNAYFMAKGVDLVGFQAVIYAGFLSFAAMNGNFLVFSVGLLIFIGFRWGIFQWVLKGSIRWAHRKLYSVPYEDQILKSVIIRASMRYRTELTDLVDMEKELLNKMKRWS